MLYLLINQVFAMKINYPLSLLLVCCFLSKATAQSFRSVTIDTLLSEKISIRALFIDHHTIWYAGDDNRVGYYNTTTGEKAEKQIEKDTAKRELRSMAQTNQSLLVANIGSPAYFWKADKATFSFQKVYTENHDKAFYDSMQFWNDLEGMALGDPTEDCLSIVITRDGGQTWKKLGCDVLPPTAEGEAAFAASNTNICVKGHNAWIVTGGKKAQVFFTPDKGNTWKVVKTPIIQGETMTGIYSADFYNDQIGCIVGGNYEQPNNRMQNKAITYDGGKTWKLIGDNEGFGYASCVQFVPKSKGKGIVTVGASGLYYSPDSGKSWQQLATDTTLYTIRFLNANTAIAAGKNKIIRIVFKK